MLFKGYYPEVTIPEVSLPEFVLHRAVELGEKAALIDGPSGRTITYGQLAGAVSKAAAGLARRGFKKGEVMGIYSPNLPEYAIAFLAVAALGGINTTVNPLYTAGELANQLNDCQAKFLLTVPPFLDKALAAAQESTVQEVFVFGEGEGATPFAALLQDEAALPQVQLDPQKDLVALPYSSGTTGLPKGVMLTHHNLIANICQIRDIEGYNEQDTLIGILPFFHIYGLTVIMCMALHKGATIVTMPRFELEQFLQIMQDYRVTRAYVVPPIVLGLAKHPLVDKYDLSSLNLVMSGAAPLGKDVAEACGRRLNCVIKQGYGLTETSPVTHINPDEPAKIKQGSIGPCISNTEDRKSVV